MKQDLKRDKGNGSALALFAAACAVLLILALLPGSASPAKNSGIAIYRVMTSNPGACLPVKGAYRDWVELANLSEETVSLSGWTLTKASEYRGGCVFSDASLAPGETVVVYGGKAIAGSAEHFLGFPLSSDGDALVLSNERGAIVETLTIPALPRGRVYALNPDDGTWSIADPEDDYPLGVDLIGNLRPVYAPGGVVINELMASNTSVARDAEGDFCDWIELHNEGASRISLEGWTLTDDDRQRNKFVFPAGAVIEPDGYVMVYASGKKNVPGQYHALFRLNADGEKVTLFDGDGKAVSYMAYTALEPDQALARNADGSVEKRYLASPGRENTRAGAKAALDSSWTLPVPNAAGVYLNEVLCGGASSSDWVELINESDRDVDLTGWGLSDKPSKLHKWIFPDGTVLHPGGMLVLGLAGSDVRSAIPEGALRVDFALDVDGSELLTLCDANSQIVDRMLLVNQRRDVSYGRVQGLQSYAYFTYPTPGAVNDYTYVLESASKVQFSVPGGIQSGPISLELKSEEGFPIYYTLDGSVPTASSYVYTGPLAISQNTVVKAIAQSNDALPSDVIASTYLFGVSHTVDLVLVSGDRDALIGPNGTMNTGERGSGYDVYVEMYAPDGEALISQGCFLKLNGRSSRTKFPQKAFRLVAKSKYGESRFHARLFSDRDYESVKAVVVRAAGQDNQIAYMRDAVLTSLAENTSVCYQEDEICAVYIDGEYWGVYHLRERVSKQMIAQFEGWDNPDALDILEGSGGARVQGSNETFHEMMDFVTTYGASSADTLARLRTYMDVENYLEYVMLEMYTNNQDLNNIRMYRNPEGDGLWRWILYDLDLGFRANRDPVEGWFDASGKVGSITSQNNTLFRALMDNPAMRDWFLTRFGELLATDLSSASVQAKIKAEYDRLAPEMVMECARWETNPATWQKNVVSFNDMAGKQTARLITSLTEQFGLTQADAQRYFGQAMENEGMLP